MATVTPKPVKVFSREEPCSKIDLFNCFWSTREDDYIPRPVVETRGEIGENAPKYLIRKGFLTTFQRTWVDYQELTELGKIWLRDGIKSLLLRHPEKLHELKHIPEDWENHDTPTPAPATRVGRRIVRRK